jgi:hypothetical protein
VIEDEDLVAQHRDAIEIVGAFLVGQRRDGRLQPRDVRLERDRDAIAKPPLHARADRSQEPGGGRGHAEADRGGLDQTGPRPGQSARKQREPQREQRIRQRGELRQHERYRHEPRLVAISEPAEAPHRRQRRRQRSVVSQGPHRQTSALRARP